MALFSFVGLAVRFGGGISSENFVEKFDSILIGPEFFKSLIRFCSKNEKMGPWIKNWQMKLMALPKN